MSNIAYASKVIEMIHRDRAAAHIEVDSMGHVDHVTISTYRLGQAVKLKVRGTKNLLGCQRLFDTFSEILPVLRRHYGEGNKLTMLSEGVNNGCKFWKFAVVCAD